MGNKKQPDFQRTKLRVGKRLPKGRNTTNTAFNSNKIVIRDQNFKTDLKDISLEELFRLLKHSNVPTKINAIERIKNFIRNNISTFISDFRDIINELGKVLFQNNIDVRKEAVELFIYSLDLLPESQMYCHITPLAYHLDCMMTHGDNSIRKESLRFLSGLLKTHPNLICCYTKLLVNLLNMISCPSFQEKESKRHSGRRLADTITNHGVSVDFRHDVLKIAVEFLEKLVINFSKKEINEDEQRIYWDGTNPLYVPLYANSGLTPAKLEFYCIEQMKSETEVSDDLRSFLSEFVPLTMSIITEEVAPAIVLEKCNILSVVNVRRLNTITQVVCHLGEWFALNSDIKSSENEKVVSSMNKIVCDKLMPRFPYTLQSYPTKKSGKSTEEEVHLNLGICYLYNTFILGTSYSKKEMEVRVVKYLCQSNTLINFVDIKSVSLMLKNIKRFIEFSSTNKGIEIRNAYETEISVVLSTICGNIMKFKNTDMAKLTEAFFIKISLNPEYKFIQSDDGMDEWIKYLFKEMKHMLTIKKANKPLLKCINQICSRENPAFMKNLSTLASPDILEYLKFDDEDYQFTIMNCITHMTNLPQDFLQDIAEFILCDTSMSTKAVVRFIRLLYHRFTEPGVQALELWTFLKFLLNVALDIVSIDAEIEDRSSESPIDIEDVRDMCDMSMIDPRNEREYNVANKQSKLDLNNIRCLVRNVQHICLKPIMPSVSWERHADIFEVCVECMLLSSRLELICQFNQIFVKVLLGNPNQPLPVHSAIAFFKFIDRISRYDGGSYCTTLYSEKVFLLSYELMLSSLLYISLMTNKVPNDMLKSFGVGELQASLNFTKENVCHIYNMIQYKISELGLDELKCLHVLRIFKFFISKQYVFTEDICNFIAMLQEMEKFCPENSPQKAVLKDIYQCLGIDEP